MINSSTLASAAQAEQMKGTKRCLRKWPIAYRSRSSPGHSGTRMAASPATACGATRGTF